MPTLDERLEELSNQQKQMEANFHQITGAIALIQQMITDKEAEEKESKKKEKEDKPKQHPLLDKAIDLLDGEII